MLTPDEYYMLREEANAILDRSRLGWGGSSHKHFWFWGGHVTGIKFQVMPGSLATSDKTVIDAGQDVTYDEALKIIETEIAIARLTC